MFDFSNCTLEEALDHRKDLGHGLTAHSPEFPVNIYLMRCVRNAGIPRMASYLNQYVLYKMMARNRDDRFPGMHPHYLTKEMILDAFSSCRSPVAVVKSEGNKVFILTDVLDGHSNPIGIVIKYNEDLDRNIVCSCYGRASFAAFLSYQMTNGTLLFYDKPKIYSLIGASYDKKILDGYALPEDKENMINLMNASFPKHKTLSDVKKAVAKKKAESAPMPSIKTQKAVRYDILVS